MSFVHRRHDGPSFGERSHWVDWLLLAALAAAMWIIMPAGSAGAGHALQGLIGFIAF
jgi:hypothetical protein